VHRQAADSGILFNAQRVLKGLAPQQRDDFVMTITDKPIDAVIDAVGHADFASLDNQIITPINRSWIGTVKLNQTLQNVLMDSNRPTINLPRNKWDKQQLRIGVGDKVIMTKNWYDMPCEDGSSGVFNGETGIVTEISDVEEVVVDFGDRVCRIPPAMQTVYQNNVMVVYPQRDLYLAYVVTTHKAQGSEYKNVIYVLNKSAAAALNRRNMYTALTRARDHVRFITDMGSLSMSLTRKEPMVFGE
jgi:ATP-dependent exoDNAse (exonuclease V) alpha subunit